MIECRMNWLKKMVGGKAPSQCKHMRRIIYISFVSLLWLNLLLSQQSDSSLTKFLQKAPPRIKECYSVLDSLAKPTWKKWVNETWSDDEVKNYASIVYEIEEYDPIKARKYGSDQKMNAKATNRNWVISDIDIIQEIQRRFPEKYKQLIKQPVWLTIAVTEMELLERPIPELPGKYSAFNIVHGKVIEVFKGRTFKINDPVTCFYGVGWGYPPLVKGNKYIVALYTMPDDPYSENLKFALGGPMHVYQSVFPIEDNYVHDEGNIFNLGTKVQLNTFLSTLKTTINEIKSWRNLAR